ncbi:MAG: DUF2809 domain-containing protein [Lachnospiraceae bacterium]|nr:DUF2809 domain-containing protein [Lachnospiraceae bacterium]
MTTMRKRVYYGIATFILLLLEIVIALFVHDDFIRPYVGDMIVVIVIYTFVRIWLPEKVRLLPMYIFIFAVFVELLQYFRIVEILGLQDNRFMRILIGSVFDIKDIACYLVGCTLLAVFEVILEMVKRKSNKKKNT